MRRTVEEEGWSRAGRTTENAVGSLLRAVEAVPVLVEKVRTMEARIAALEAEGTQEPRKDWLTLEEAAQALNCSPRKVRYLIDEGKIKKNLHSRRILIPASELEAFEGRATLPRFS